MAATSARELYLRHRSRIYRFLRNVTGDPSLAEDLTQDTFVRVLRGLETYEPRERDVAWLFRIARRLLLDHRRGARRQPAIVSIVEGQSNRPDPDPFVAVSLAEALRHVEESEREAFLLREQGGLGYTEIAAIAGCTPDAVRNRIYRARCALRQLLAPTLTSARKGFDTEQSP